MTGNRSGPGSSKGRSQTRSSLGMEERSRAAGLAGVSEWSVPSAKRIRVLRSPERGFARRVLSRRVARRRGRATTGPPGSGSGRGEAPRPLQGLEEAAHRCGLQPGRAAPPRDGLGRADLGRPHRGLACTRSSAIPGRPREAPSAPTDSGSRPRAPITVGLWRRDADQPFFYLRRAGTVPKGKLLTSASFSPGRAIRPRLGHGRGGAAVSLQDLRRSTGTPRAGEGAPPGATALGGSGGGGI